jgi:predicted metal-binding protein
MTHTLFVCDTCCAENEQPNGATFAAALREAASADPDLRALDIRTVSCLNVCSEPLALALRAPEKAAYLFAGIIPETDLADTLAMAKLFVQAEAGEITDARPAGRLRFCLKGRIPAL